MSGTYMNFAADLAREHARFLRRTKCEPVLTCSECGARWEPVEALSTTLGLRRLRVCCNCGAEVREGSEG